VCCSVLQGVAVRYSVLQCVAACCSVLQCVAVCYDVKIEIAIHCNTLQCLYSSNVREKERERERETERKRDREKEKTTRRGQQKKWQSVTGRRNMQVLVIRVIWQRPDWGVYSKSGRQVCIASICLLVNFRKASLYFCFCTRKDWLTKKGKFLFDIPRKSAPFVPSRVGASKHETFSRTVLRNKQKWTFSRTVLGKWKIS